MVCRILQSECRQRKVKEEFTADRERRHGQVGRVSYCSCIRCRSLVSGYSAAAAIGTLCTFCSVPPGSRRAALLQLWMSRCLPCPANNLTADVLRAAKERGISILIMVTIMHACIALLITGSSRTQVQAIIPSRFMSWNTIAARQT